MSKAAALKRTFTRLRKRGPYACPACARVFALPMGLSRHRQAQHLGADLTPVLAESPQVEAVRALLDENTALRGILTQIRRALGNGQP